VCAHVAEHEVEVSLSIDASNLSLFSRRRESAAAARLHVITALGREQHTAA